MSYADPDGAIHVWVRNGPDGWARAACGLVVPEGVTTRDPSEVTCKHPGCVAEVRARLEQRARVKKSP